MRHADIGRTFGNIGHCFVYRPSASPRWSAGQCSQCRRSQSAQSAFRTALRDGCYLLARRRNARLPVGGRPNWRPLHRPKARMRHAHRRVIPEGESLLLRRARSQMPSLVDGSSPRDSRHRNDGKGRRVGERPHAITARSRPSQIYEAALDERCRVRCHSGILRLATNFRNQSMSLSGP